MNAMASIWRKNMLWYLFLDVIYPEKRKLWTSRNRWRLRTNVCRQQVVLSESCSWNKKEAFHGWNQIDYQWKETWIGLFHVLNSPIPIQCSPLEFDLCRVERSPAHVQLMNFSPPALILPKIRTVSTFVSAHMFYASRKAWFTAMSALWPWRN